MTPTRLAFFREHVARAANITPAMGVELLQHIDAQAVVVERLREAIRTHGECVTVCRRCGGETPNFDDDVCLALEEPTP